MRMRKKKNLIPRMEKCAAVHVRDGFGLRGEWRETLMPEAAELRVELGCGKAALLWKRPPAPGDSVHCH